MLEKLQKAVSKSIKTRKDYYDSLNYPDIYNEDRIRAEALQDYYFYANTGFVSFTNARFSKKDIVAGFITNVIRTTAKSSDEEIQFLIEKLNKTYENFITMFNEKECKHV